MLEVDFMCSFFILSWPGDLLLWRFLIAVETSDSVIGSLICSFITFSVSSLAESA